MKRHKANLPISALEAKKKFECHIFADGGNEYHYLKDSRVLEYFTKRTELKSTSIKVIIQEIELALSNDDIKNIYWIVDGGDEHNQCKEFKDFYINWFQKKDSGQQAKSWAKLKILINHPCLEYWFLLYKCDPPCHPQTKKLTVFSYDQKKCPSPCKTLQENADFKTAFPGYSKDGNDIKKIANDTVGRKQAIVRAKKLDAGKPNKITAKNLLTHPRAEIYQLFI